jgi:hypothetical protein
MCLIAVGNSEALRRDVLAASKLHKDAWGVINLYDGRARKGTGMIPFSQIPEFQNVAIHLRQATAGGGDIINAQPIVMPRLWLMHNGHIRQLSGDFLSDSYLVAHRLDYIMASERLGVVKAFNALRREYDISLGNNRFLIVTREGGELVGRAWGMWFLVRGCVLESNTWHLESSFYGLIRAGELNGDVVFRGSKLCLPENWAELPYYYGYEDKDLGEYEDYDYILQRLERSCERGSEEVGI